MASEGPARRSWSHAGSCPHHARSSRRHHSSDRPPSWCGRRTTGRTLTRAHLLAGVLDHGYALTVHQAQGLTVDRVFLLADTGLYREAGYVGLSRARHRSELHLNDAPDNLTHTEDDLDRPPEPLEHIEALQAITRALERSKAQRTAHDLTR